MPRIVLKNLGKRGAARVVYKMLEQIMISMFRGQEKAAICREKAAICRETAAICIQALGVWNLSEIYYF